MSWFVHLRACPVIPLCFIPTIFVGRKVPKVEALSWVLVLQHISIQSADSIFRIRHALHITVHHYAFTELIPKLRSEGALSVI